MEPGLPEMTAILDAISAAQTDRREEGRTTLLQFWGRFSGPGQPLERCAIAHALADTEPKVADELEWDLRALEAATGTRAPEDRDALSPVPETFLASLHLNAADAYRRLGNLQRARQHATFAQDRLAALPDDGYGRMIRRGVAHLHEQLRDS